MSIPRESFTHWEISLERLRVSESTLQKKKLESAVYFYTSPFVADMSCSWKGFAHVHGKADILANHQCVMR